MSTLTSVPGGILVLYKLMIYRCADCCEAIECLVLRYCGSRYMKTHVPRQACKPVLHRCCHPVKAALFGSLNELGVLLCLGDGVRHVSDNFHLQVSGEGQNHTFERNLSFLEEK